MDDTAARGYRRSPAPARAPSAPSAPRGRRDRPAHGPRADSRTGRGRRPDARAVRAAAQKSSTRRHQYAGGGGRRLAAGVRDLVGNAAVDLVSDPGQHRHRHLRDGAGHDLAVERGEVAARPAAANEDDGVEVELSEPPQRKGDTSRRGATLDPDVDVGDPERMAARLQLLDEVVMAALPPLVTSPTRSGTGGSSWPHWPGAHPRRPGRGSARSRSAASRPTVNTGSMPFMTSWSRPDGG